MAIWQFQCNIIPVRKNMECSTYDEIISWKGVPLPKYEIDFLEVGKAWSNDIVLYGNVDETCVKFIFDKDILDVIECRLDLRSLTKSKLSALLGYVDKIGGAFWIDGNIHLPRMEEIVEVMKNSDANRFCRNPGEYILQKTELSDRPIDAGTMK